MAKVNKSDADPRDDDQQGSNKKYSSDLIVFLDLDLTLISDPEEVQVQLVDPITPPTKSADKSLLARLGDAARKLCKRLYGNDVPENDNDSFLVTLDGVTVRVYKRPFLDKFLRQVTSQYETHIFTAGSKGWADKVLAELDPTGTLIPANRRWYSDSCTMVHYRRGRSAGEVPVKNIQKLPGLEKRLDPGRFVIVDDYALTMAENPSNGIPVTNCYKGEKGDKTLIRVLALLNRLKAPKDVRPHLEKRFRVKACQEFSRMVDVMFLPEPI